LVFYPQSLGFKKLLALYKVFKGVVLPIISIYRKLASLWWLGQKEKT